MTTWIRVEQLKGNDVAASVELLNQALGLSYKPNRIYQWERGESLPSRAVYEYMLKRSIPTVLAHLEIGNNEMQQIIDKLTMPKVV